MFTQITSYHDDWTAQMLAFEERIGRPLRILNGRARTFDPASHPWTAPQAFVCGNRTIEDCEENGLTWVIWSTLHEARFTNNEYPVGICHELTWGGERSLNLSDNIEAPERGYLADLFVPDGMDFPIGEVADRLILSYIFADYTSYIDPELVWIPMLERSLDSELRERLAEQRATYDRDRFAVHAASASNSELVQLTQEIENLADSVTNYQQRLSRAQVNLRHKTSLLDAYLQRLAESEQATEEQLVAQWESLLAHPKIDTMAFTSEHQLVIVTNDLNLIHPITGEEVLLGKMHVRLNLATSDPWDGNFITIRNLTNPKAGHDHPHVHRGTPCFGELGDTIYRLFQSGKYEAALEMLFKFFESVNPGDDWGRRAAYWFDPEREERAVRLGLVAAE